MILDLTKPEMDNSKAVFEKAIRKVLVDFKRKLTTREEEQYKNMTLEQLKKDIIVLQKNQNEAKTMMNLNRIRGFLEGMEQLGKVVEIFLNASEILAFVWGPMKFLLLVSSISDIGTTARSVQLGAVANLNVFRLQAILPKLLMRCSRRMRASRSICHFLKGMRHYLKMTNSLRIFLCGYMRISCNSTLRHSVSLRVPVGCILFPYSPPGYRQYLYRWPDYRRYL